MTELVKESQLNRIKKLAAKGKVGLYLATLWLGLLIIAKKLWKILEGPTYKVAIIFIAFFGFFSIASFVPVSNNELVVEDEAYYDLVIDEELDAEEYIQTSVSEEDEMASLDDLIDSSSEHEDLNSDVDHAAFDKNAWNLLLVNKQHPIPDDYTFTLGTIKGTMKCDERILEPLTSMFAAAAEDGIGLIVCSPYRDISRQEYLFDRKMKNYINSGLSYIEAYKEASAVVTVPGSSEHQIGLSLDIICDHYSALNDGFGETDAGIWLKNNSYKYGFILRYPKDKEYITGIIYEPWHFRYVGIEAATYMYENNLTLEELIESL